MVSKEVGGGDHHRWRYILSLPSPAPRRHQSYYPSPTSPSTLKELRFLIPSIIKILFPRRVACGRISPKRIPFSMMPGKPILEPRRFLLDRLRQAMPKNAPVLHSINCLLRLIYRQHYFAFLLFYPSPRSIPLHAHIMSLLLQRLISVSIRPEAMR